MSFGKQVAEDDILLPEWSAESDVARFALGVDTFVIRDDKIRRQTMCFVVAPK